MYISDTSDYDFLKYRQHVDNVTKKFISLSQNIRTIEASFKENGNPQLANIIRGIQMKEKEKLDLVRFKDCLLPENKYTPHPTMGWGNSQGGGV
jgi:hypothetical protein